MLKLAEGIYQHTIAQFVNIYVIAGTDGVGIIDTGVSGGLVNILRRELPKLGLAFEDIRHILLTHAHFDHIGGLKKLRAALPTAKLYAGTRETPILTGAEKLQVAPRSELRGLAWLTSFGLVTKVDPTTVEVMLNEGDRLDHLRGLEVVNLPGHSVGQIGFYLPSARLLIGGDVMFSLPLLGVKMPLRAASADWAQAKESIRKVAAMDVDILSVGHVSAVVGGAGAKIKALAARIS
ncbi:MAG TPA: MBL fold metallo-hydrolase [Aggregatilineales bacterium]|nr:MBL fold metallo-hydrolase [Anaerolineales bacterium]HRE48364.1 MBL fold metallo-hydrolase [Aggregatilineales bacterium]